MKFFLLIFVLKAKMYKIKITIRTNLTYLFEKIVFSLLFFIPRGLFLIVSDPDPTCQVITDPEPTFQVISDPDPDR